MGRGRQKRRKLARKRRPKKKTKQKLLAALVERPHKWTTLRHLAQRVSANTVIVNGMMHSLTRAGLVALQTCAKWEGGWRYRPLPKCWPEDAELRGLVMAEATSLGSMRVPVEALAKNVSTRILGFEAPNVVMRIIQTMVAQGELTHPAMYIGPAPGAFAGRMESVVDVSVDYWLKRTAQEQTRAGMV